MKKFIKICLILFLAFWFGFIERLDYQEKIRKEMDKYWARQNFILALKEGR